MNCLFSFKRNRFLALVLAVVLAVGCIGCSAAGDDSDDVLKCTVSIDNLEVHKKANDRSRVLDQLPLDLEVVILEQKAVKETTWGRIDKMKLDDGTKIKAGWINLEYVRFPGEPDPNATEPMPEDEIEIPTITVSMGTVTANKLNIRKGPDSKYETDGAYYQGDRIEILETQTAGDTIWGRTNLGWIGMGYVRMDGTAPDTASSDPTAPKLTSDGNYTVLGYGVVNLGELNVRLGPGTNYPKVRSVTMATRYAYYQLVDGWARIEDGWVSTDYFYVEGTTTDSAITGTVTTNDLNIRSGPNTSFRSQGTYQKGDTVEILAQVDAWGYTPQGWVFMNYVEAHAPTYSTGEGTTTTGLNIRKEPNPDSEIVGAYTMGETVNILEVKENWGRTDLGWINLKYVKYKSVG